MKKFLLAILIAIAAVIPCALSAGCGNKSDGKIKIVCTTFPTYDWTKNIVGDSDKFNVVCLANGKDSHSFDIVPSRALDIYTCDMFIGIGGESESRWAPQYLNQKQNENMIIINLMEVLEEELIEEDEFDDEEHEEGEESIHEDDEHIWLSLKLAKKATTYIASKICELEPLDAQTYTNNSQQYCSLLSTLDGEYSTASNDAKHHTLVFGDRFPFRYLCDDYNIAYFAASSGCAADNPKLSVVNGLKNKIIELGLGCVIKIETCNHSVPTAIKTNYKDETGKDLDILTLNSIQSIDIANIGNDVTYLSIMRSNLEVLKQALN